MNIDGIAHRTIRLAADGRTVLIVPEVKDNQTTGLTLMHVTLRRDLGQIALILKDFQRVRIAAGRITAMAPQRFEGELLAAFWKRDRGDLSGALESATAAQRLAASTSSAPALVRGMILHEMGRTQDAEASFIQALSIDPNDARAQELLASVSTD